MSREIVENQLNNDMNTTSRNMPGASLKRMRESLGLTEDQVALQLHLSSHIVIALENDDIQQLPAFTFVRGYLRSYAKLLNLSADDIIQAFNALYPQAAAPLTATLPPRKSHKMVIKRRNSQDKIVRWIGYAIAAVLLVMVILWWHNHTTMQDAATSRQSFTAMTNPASNDSTTPAAIADSAAALQPIGPANSEQDQMAITNPVAAIVANTAANTPGLQSDNPAAPASKTVNPALTAANAAAVPGLAPTPSTVATAPTTATPAKKTKTAKSWHNPDDN